MYIDSRKLDGSYIVQTDICIIGAGAAGITLAREFVKTPSRVCLLESGGFTLDPATQSLTDAINVGREYPILKTSRLRYFGGTTNHWGGHCVPIRGINFERRSSIPYSGWPFDRNHLDQYYKRAHDVLQLGEFTYDTTAMSKSLEMDIFPFNNANVETVVSRYNPFEFGEAYREQLKNATNVSTYLFANVTSINQNPDSNYVSDVSVKTLTGNTFTVRAKYFVLATGGIDNARLLLLSNQVQKNGLGNQNDLVGRFFMEHIWYPSGLILPVNQDESLQIYGAEHPYRRQVKIRAHIALPEKVIREQEVPDFRAEIYIGRNFMFHESVSSARFLRDKIANLEWPENFGEHVANIIRDPGTVVNYLRDKQGPLFYRLKNFVEQTPNPDSRIALSKEKDALGLLKPTLDWRLSEIDKVGIRKAHQLIAREVGRSGFGRMRIMMPEDEDILLEGASGGYHHMGTTRMHVDPRKGIVDPDCRIHGLQNIFVAGSSVFPTCGYANPTLTIVALSLRLADHLSSLMARER